MDPDPYSHLFLQLCEACQKVQVTQICETNQRIHGFWDACLVAYTTKQWNVQHSIKSLRLAKREYVANQVNQRCQQLIDDIVTFSEGSEQELNESRAKMHLRVDAMVDQMQESLRERSEAAKAKIQATMQDTTDSVNHGDEVKSEADKFYRHLNFDSLDTQLRSSFSLHTFKWNLLEQFQSIQDNIRPFEVEYVYELPAKMPPVFYCNGTTRTVVRYDVFSERVEKREIAGLPQEFSGNNNWVALSLSKIMICGEMVDFIGQPDCYIYDFKEDSLIKKADMIQGRCTHGIGKDQDEIYVFGGVHEDDIDTCEIYSVEADLWTPLLSLPRPMNNVSAILLGQSYYLTAFNTNTITIFDKKSYHEIQVNELEIETFKHVAPHEKNGFLVITGDSTLAFTQDGNVQGDLPGSGKDSWTLGETIYMGDRIYYVYSDGPLYQYKFADRAFQELKNLSSI